MANRGLGPRAGHGTRLRATALATIVALAVAALALIGVASPAAASETDTLHSLVNQARAANGLGALARNGAMDAVALNWANALAAAGALSHNPNYSAQIPGGWSSAAENVAQGHPSGSSMHDGWMGSSGHRSNILGDFTDVGMAFVAAGGTTWGVQVFARYGASVPPPAPPPAPPAPPPAPAPAPAAPPAALPSAPAPAAPTPTPATDAAARTPASGSGGAGGAGGAGSAGGSAGARPGSASTADDSAAAFETTSAVSIAPDTVPLAIVVLIAVLLAVAVLTVGARSARLADSASRASRIRSGPLPLEVRGVAPVPEVEDLVRPRPE